MENHALDIIDMLYNMIAEAWGVPLGNDKCIVERDKALNLLDDLKATLPMELSEARRLVNARDEFVANAKQEADNIRRGAWLPYIRSALRSSALPCPRRRGRSEI